MGLYKATWQLADDVQGGGKTKNRRASCNHRQVWNDTYPLRGVNTSPITGRPKLACCPNRPGSNSAQMKESHTEKSLLLYRMPQERIVSVIFIWYKFSGKKSLAFNQLLRCTCRPVFFKYHFWKANLPYPAWIFHENEVWLLDSFGMSGSIQWKYNSRLKQQIFFGITAKILFIWAQPWSWVIQFSNHIGL